jgi:hypothetical protein
MRRFLTATVALVALIAISLQADAHQIVATVGYANSSTPEHGTEVSNYVFDAGGGYAAGLRIDLERQHFWFGPAFAFWNNLTGDPDPNANSSYFQAELGGRISARTHTVPAIYGGVGAGYTFSHGEFVPKFFGGKETFDGDFPTGSAHFGVKTPSQTTGVGLVGEVSYSFPLSKPSGRDAVGPARAFLVQIGIVLDIRLANDRSSN